MMEICESKQLIKIDVITPAYQQEKKAEKEDEIEGRQEECPKEESKVYEETQEMLGEKEEKHHPQQEGDTKFQKLKMIDLMNEHINRAVEQKINSMMPCIINRVQESMGTGLPKIECDNTVVHEGTACSGCATTPIKGINYKCLQCQ
jgi:hypothetical protein